ncbi:DUF1289 domain-containing protein [Polynucleobacter paneuropaeus]|uniref:DUF1289 domain-containing protein n=1 Tax=Polynucleobacter paneuropaeus TaxID=2527775 RepID=A0A2Z4JV00_9BURK|nr:DUF1289 domain-containing protein [Polynucleobacter paneuropaeus]AWW48879.1 DUF1289 domain-containing protein [Polynucleobacter paneuropaeus]AWW50735.1 DUF1289 domain-containing protein [Polynucleobacter paneuropaeus]MBT8520417.1 DUF1289 domain-containing protein [Polynucleobacter paneuropaeus]MBT8521662.1 DUF1289 domain-containing protein [Polynucleobacter paneuropaeus]MBT8526365.1 DUF1289 domain-containing protein [Polynucleobacter paneuropaeus]
MTTVPSPCNNFCEIDPQNGYCRGCYRTLTEITSWSVMTDAEKLAVYAHLSERRPQ